MFRCGFPSAAYNPAVQATLADRIVVQATRPTAASQLTTIIGGGVPGVPGVGLPTTLPPGFAPTPGVPGVPGITPTPGFPLTSLRTTTYTTNFGQGLTTGTATIRATAAVVSQGLSTAGAPGLRAGGEGVVGWKAVLAYTVGVAAVAAWFF